MDRKDYHRLYKIALRCRRDNEPPCVPPILLQDQLDLLWKNTIGYLETNNLERIKAYGDVLKQWTTDLPVFPLFLRVSPMVARKELKNWRSTKTSAPETWNSYQWELPAKG